MRTTVPYPRITWLALCALLLPGALVAQQPQQQPPQQEAPPSPQPPAQAQRAPQSPKKERLTLDRILQRLPRRVTTKDGKPGDMVNFLLIGSKEKMEAALKDAGWIQVDRTPKDAIMHAIAETLEKRAYAEMPMSQLYLFGQPQDYGFAQGIPIHIVTERDHFRLWEAPWLTADGQTVWVGAGTHDVGIEKIGNTDKLTHAIDPDVDKERAFIAQSLEDEKLIKQVRYLAPANPVRQALTATGDPFHSDGRILVIFLK